MRIKIEFEKTDKTVPVNHQHLVNTFIHDLLGRNNKYHDAHSNYSISPLCGGKLNEDKETLSFMGSPFIVASSNDLEFINKLIVGILNKPTIGDGIRFKNMDFIEEKIYNGYNYFNTLSPVLLKDKNTNKAITFNDENYEKLLEDNIKNKLSKFDKSLDLTNFKIEIKPIKVKKIIVKNVKNPSSVLNLKVTSNRKVADALYNLGVGKSTGSGFGMIYKSENFDLYKF